MTFPKFQVVRQEYPEYVGYMVMADTPWGLRILCADMTEDKADWLTRLLNDTVKTQEEMPVWS